MDVKKKEAMLKIKELEEIVKTNDKAAIESKIEELKQYGINIKNNSGKLINNENEKTKGSFWGIIFIIWFISSIIGMIYFSGTEDLSYIAIMLFGHVFMVFGFIAFFSTYKEMKKVSMEVFMPLIFIAVGGGCFLIPLFMQFPGILGSLNIILDWEMLLPCLLLLIFFIVGLGMFIAAIVKKKRYNNTNLIIVTGKVIKLRETRGENGMLYAPDIEYEYDGTKIYKSNTYTNVNVPHIGDIVEIKIDPITKEVLYKTSNFEFYLLLFMGIMFMAMSVFALYMFLFA